MNYWLDVPSTMLPLYIQGHALQRLRVGGYPLYSLVAPVGCISRLPEKGEKAPKRDRFAETAIGYVHVDVCELRLAGRKLHMFLAIDHVSKFTYVESHERASPRMSAGPTLLS